MSAGTKIEWTDCTWNPVRGCSRVSEGCRNCYAERVAARFSGEGERFHGFAERRDSDLNAGGGSKPRWTGRVELIESKLTEPLRWRKPRRVFVNSMSDLFHEALPDEAIDRVFAVMALAPQHTFQVLTKRPERMREYVKRLPLLHLPPIASGRGCDTDALYDQAYLALRSGALPNVWLGVSVEDQKTADERIPKLLSTPAAVRFVSYEPALGPVDFNLDQFVPFSAPTPKIDWIIVGGESGPGARPIDVAWVRSVVAQCKEAGVACFVKQLGAYPIVRHPTDQREVEFSRRCGFLPAWVPEWAAAWIRNFDRKGGDPSEWPADLRVREFPAAVF